MSVPKGKRTQSKFEVYHHAVKMRTEITRWLLRDFGVKVYARTLPDLAKRNKMSEEDTALLGAILDKYNLGDKVLEDFPAWWIAERRRKIDEICSDMMMKTSKANSIYATSTEEFWGRRTHQNEAIGCVYALLAEVQFVASVLWRTTGADIEKYIPFTKLCEEQIALLKAWRKSDNAVLKRLTAKE